jgi:hypothetical protein
MERLTYTLFSIIGLAVFGYSFYLAWFKPDKYMENARSWRVFKNWPKDILLHLIGRGLGTSLLIIEIFLFLQLIFYG